jgi:16S rRNA (guanine527-N7)-methyltransferase
MGGGLPRLERFTNCMTVEHPRLRELGELYRLPEPAVLSIASLLGILESEQSAPTGITDRDQAIEVHLADSLVALELAEVRGATSIADIGAGAGFPSLPLAIALPDARVSLIESAARKCDFLRHAIETAGVENAVVVNTRVEKWEDGRDAYDLVVARALGALPVVVEYAAPMLWLNGILVAWKGRRDQNEESAGAAAAEQLGLEPVEVRPVKPFPAAQHRHLHVFRKREPTPPGFPRRAGMAVKRPLGSRK